MNDTKELNGLQKTISQRPVHAHTMMEAFRPDAPLRLHTALPTRFYRQQMHGYGSEGGWLVTSRIGIPIYCDSCARDGELFWESPEYILRYCKMEDPKWSATPHEHYDTGGWRSTCPNCGAQTFQVIDLHEDYSHIFK